MGITSQANTFSLKLLGLLIYKAISMYDYFCLKLLKTCACKSLCYILKIDVEPQCSIQLKFRIGYTRIYIKH